MSAYHGNGKPAIGVSIQRALSGFALPTIDAVTAKLPELERQFPGISFEIADTQGELIGKSVSNMVDALRDAILLTVLVIFLFLADTRGMILAGISIPFTYLITFAFMWLFGFQFDMVTLTGVILGVGMLLDDAIVVLENIERHYHKLGKDLSAATIGGTEEVMLAILSGTYATVVVLLPIIYIGGFVQTVLRPLSLTLSIALLASYLVSVTILPILAPFILRLGGRTEKWGWEKKLDHVVNGTILHRIQEFFVKVVEVALRRKALFILPAVLLLVISGRVVMPLVGRDLMPPMDTGIFRVTFEAYPNTSLAQAEALLSQAEKAIREEPGVVRTSATLGSEPGVLTFGSGRNPQQAFVTVHLVDRFHRKETLWDVERSVLARLRIDPRHPLPGGVRLRRHAALHDPLDRGPHDLRPRPEGPRLRLGGRGEPAADRGRPDVRGADLDARPRGGPLPPRRRAALLLRYRRGRGGGAGERPGQGRARPRPSAFRSRTRSPSGSSRRPAAAARRRTSPRSRSSRRAAASRSRRSAGSSGPSSRRFTRGRTSRRRSTSSATARRPRSRTSTTASPRRSRA